MRGHYNPDRKRLLQRLNTNGNETGQRCQSLIVIEVKLIGTERKQYQKVAVTGNSSGSSTDDQPRLQLRRRS